ncbi:LemA family protein [uncultured Shewanella sp.]|uniref:LemA family protein n=1 Tax=uncultured Shewanella sp. TaxID=173975 RepID=UPI002604FD73|nr:LemA family protein [uncultured Shewanella sp.]
MEGIVFAMGLLLVMTYLWIMSLFKKRQAVLDALGIIDSYVAKQTNLIDELLALKIEVSMVSIIAITRRLKADYKKLKQVEVTQHFVDMQTFEQLMQPILSKLENNRELTQQAAVFQTIQSYQELAELIKGAYQFYNVAVSEFNTAVNVFPGVMIAYILRVNTMPLYPIKRHLS